MAQLTVNKPVQLHHASRQENALKLYNYLQTNKSRSATVTEIKAQTGLSRDQYYNATKVLLKAGVYKELKKEFYDGHYVILKYKLYPLNKNDFKYLPKNSTSEFKDKVVTDSTNNINLNTPSTDDINLDTPNTDDINLDTPNTDDINLDTPSTDNTLSNALGRLEAVIDVVVNTFEERNKIQTDLSIARRMLNSQQQENKIAYTKINELRLKIADILQRER